MDAMSPEKRLYTSATGGIPAELFSRRRARMTSPTFLLDSCIFVEKRPMMREKSRCYHDPARVTTHGIQSLGDRLQGQHKRCVVRHILADFVHKEIETESRGLPVNVRLHELCEVVHRKIAVGVAPDDIRRRGTGDGGIGLVDLRTVARDAGAPVRPPVLAGQLLELGREGVEMSRLLVELALELRHGGILLAVAAMRVEHLQERRKDRVFAVGATRRVRLATDVEEDALGRSADCPLHETLQERQIFLPLAQRNEDVRRPLAAHVTVLDDRGEDLQEMRLTGTEEAGDPRAVGVALVVVLEERLEIGADLIRNDELLELVLEYGGVLRLDDALDVAVDILLEKLCDVHDSLHDAKYQSLPFNARSLMYLPLSVKRHDFEFIAAKYICVSSHGTTSPARSIF